MASDWIDFSEFLSEYYFSEEKVEAIKVHMQKLQRSYNCSKFGEVKLLGTTDGCRIIAALKALLPESGQERTIQRVELNVPYSGTFCEEQDLPQDRSNLTVECFCLHCDLYEYIRNCRVPDFGSIKRLFEKLPTGITVQRTELVCTYQSYETPPSRKECDAVIEAASNVNIENVVFESLKDSLKYDEDCIECHTTFVAQLKNAFWPAFLRKELINSESLRHLNLKQIHANTSKGGGVAVALLSSGYNQLFRREKNVVAEYNFIELFSPVHERYSVGVILTEIVSEVAPDAKLIPCRTTSRGPWYSSTSGVTYRALNQLREMWKAREWGEDVHSLVVLIPYGGHYREDEMRAINAAIDDGIIVVCAAGDTIPQASGKHIPGIAFPASMGNVLCVGAVDKNNEPTVVSPSGREVDCVVAGTDVEVSGVSTTGTGISAAILSGLIALILSFIESSLSKMPGTHPEYNHVSIVREVLQQTTTYARHHSHSGYGLLTSRLFSFSERQLQKLLSSITQERIFRTIPGSASEVTEQCKFNSEILSNDELNSELQLPVALDGGGISVAVIDDDFPGILKTNYKADELETEMHSWDECTPSLSENAELLKGSMTTFQEFACSLRRKIPYVAQVALQLQEKAKSIESQIDSMNEEVCFDFTSVKDSHGLQCALVVANTTPKADLLLVNSHFDSTSLATMIENLVERPKRPDVIVCSLGFDQFDLKLSKAVNKAINSGVIPVFSAGNIGLTGSNTIGYPSRFGNVLCIGAHTWHGTPHSFSSVGREVDFLAPGEFMILGKYPVSGTSFAAPAVAAFIALILQYVDKVVSGEWKHRPLEDKYMTIDAWSEAKPGNNKWGWNKIPLNVACRNVYVMRELLRQMSVHRTEHSDSAGYGNLDIRRLLKDLEPEDIHSIVQNFHQPSPLKFWV